MKIMKISQKLKNFTKITKRNLYITQRGRPSREQSHISDAKGNVPDLLYFKQMKEFIKEAQGVPPYSQKWVEIRNKHYKILYDKSSETSEKFKQSMDTQYLRFYVLIIPEQTECYELVSILNFYQIRYKALEDSPVSKSIMKQLLGSSLGVGNVTKSTSVYSNYKNFKFPFLIFETSEEATKTFEGLDNILEFLIENNFIHDYKSHTIYEKDGLVFASEVEKCFENLMKKFGNRFSFFFRVTNFKEARYWYHPFKDGYIYRNRILSRVYRLGKELIKDFRFYFQGRNTKKLFYSTNEKNLVDKIITWVERMNSKPFHGGDIPDAADFKMFSIMRKFSNCRKIKFFLKNLTDSDGSTKNSTEEITGNKVCLSTRMESFIKFDDWNSKMSLLCSRDNFYNIREVGYNYNRYMSEEVLENERINKPLHETQEENNKNMSENGHGTNASKNSVKMNPIMGVFGNKIKRNKINF